MNKLTAQEIAKANCRAHGAWNDRKMTFAHPSKAAGYGLVLIALSKFPKSQRKTQMQVASKIWRPVRSTSRYNPVTGTKLKDAKYFSTHGAWASLSNAKLIDKVDGAWTLTKLGKRYVKEMKLA